MIAATAEVHALTVVTRNVRDFRRFGRTTLDPFSLGGPDGSRASCAQRASRRQS